MKNIDFRKDVLPHLLAAGIFYLCTLIYFSPIVFDNKEINQYDILQHFAGSKDLEEYREEAGKEALWGDRMFSGMPAYLLTLRFSGDLLIYAQKAYSLFLFHPAQYLFAGMLSFYILLLCFGVRPYISILGGLAFMLTSYVGISISVGHNAKIGVMSYAPLVLGGVHLVLKENPKRWLGLALTAFGLGIALRINHLQVVYYLLLIILVYGAHQLVVHIKNKTVPRLFINVAFLLIPVVLAIGANLGKIWTILEYGQYSMRGGTELTILDDASSEGLDKSYAFNYSNGIWEPMTWFIPNFKGGATQDKLPENSSTAEALQRAGMNRNQVRGQLEAMPTYFGTQPYTAGPYYIGAVVIFLFVLAMFILPARIRNWMIILVALSVVLSWGKNFSAFNDLMFDFFPGYNKFRSVTMVIVLSLVVMPLGAFLGLEKILAENSWKKYQKQVLYALAATGGVATIVALAAAINIGDYSGAVDSQLPEVLRKPLRSDRAMLVRQDAFRTLIFVLLAAGTLWAMLNNRLKTLPGLIVLGGLLIADLYGVTRRYFNDEDFTRSAERGFAAMTEADERILRDESIKYRVLNLRNPFNEARTSYYHNSLGGYHGAKMRRYQDLIDIHISKELQTFIQGIQQGNRPFQDLQVVNMLNAKYMLAGDNAASVIENPEAMGNAWLVNQVQQVNSPDEEIMALGEIDLNTSVVVDASDFDVESTYSGVGTIELSSHEPGRLVYKADINGGEALAVFSEIYYPEGWSATIDGTKHDIKRVNYILRGLEVPEGQHEIEFEFEPKSYYMGNKVMMVSSILLYITVIFGVVINIRRP